MYSYDRSAAGKFDPKIVKEIRELTDANDHAGADALGAKMLGVKKLEQKLQLVSQLLKLEGSTPPSLRDYVYNLHTTLMTLAKQMLSPEEYDQFRRGF